MFDYVEKMAGTLTGASHFRFEKNAENRIQNNKQAVYLSKENKTMITKDFPIEIGCEVTTWNHQKKTGGCGLVVGILDNGQKLRVLRQLEKGPKVFRVKTSAVVCVTKTAKDVEEIAKRLAEEENKPKE